MFAGFNSCVDWPSAHYWRELITVYPDAKVVLTTRSPESWWDSCEKTILRGIETSTDMASLGIALVRDQVFGGRPGDRAHAVTMYEANVAAVKATVPAGRLLVHELGDGWEPLRKHLGAAVPEVAYPSRNSTTQFQRAILGAGAK